MSRRLLVSIEQGEANPSIGSILRLSDTLGVGLSALVAAPTAARPQSPVEAAEQSCGLPRQAAALDSLPAPSPPDVLELWDWAPAPDDRHSSEPYATGATELLQVLGGSIAIEIADAVYTLDTGDAAAFPGDVAHAYRNDAESPARFSLAVSEPR